MKKLLLVVCMMAGILSMTACTAADKTAEEESYNGYTASDFQSNAESLYETIASFDDEQITAYMASGDEIIMGAITSWRDIKDDIGEYVGFGDFSMTENHGEITTQLVIEYTEHNMLLNVSYDENLAVASITADREYSIGEIMSKAGLNTVMGIGTVFVILILISFLISGFSIINKWEEKQRLKHAPAKPEAAVVVPAVEAAPQTEEDLTDDLELVAVITAAIAASAGTSGDGFVVRSIKRRTTKTR